MILSSNKNNLYLLFENMTGAIEVELLNSSSNSSLLLSQSSFFSNLLYIPYWIKTVMHTSLQRLGNSFRSNRIVSLDSEEIQETEVQSAPGDNLLDSKGNTSQHDQVDLNIDINMTLLYDVFSQYLITISLTNIQLWFIPLLTSSTVCEVSKSSWLSTANHQKGFVNNLRPQRERRVLNHDIVTDLNSLVKDKYHILVDGVVLPNISTIDDNGDLSIHMLLLSMQNELIESNTLESRDSKADVSMIVRYSLWLHVVQIPNVSVDSTDIKPSIKANILLDYDMYVPQEVSLYSIMQSNLRPRLHYISVTHNGECFREYLVDLKLY